MMGYRLETPDWPNIYKKAYKRLETCYALPPPIPMKFAPHLFSVRFAQKTVITNPEWIKNLKKTLKPKWWKMFFRKEKFKEEILDELFEHTNSRFDNTRERIRDTERDVCNLITKLSSLESQNERLKEQLREFKEQTNLSLLTKSTYPHRIQPNSPLDSQSVEEYKEKGFELSGVTEDGKWQIWVKKDGKL